ncbi:hypothetical protein ELH02_14070 [Rhizobium ruizarguesonis]|uniref:hypothetical protein n=1 Tax=Rhizobium ruizarguesonis TaxID=2081791 RepID=UPI001031FA68|nr:hypothetical protein [Rhizobium ruizarguesonis]TBE45416.1 hypothetical protein ELH02_14070 [Rhizobium ruizarguesonis]
MKTWNELKAKYPRLLRTGFFFECHEGWVGILDDYFVVIDRELPSEATYELRQVKEKLGFLRIYDSSYGEPLSSVRAVTYARALAEARSYHTCEYCGRPGVWSSRRGYLSTVCDDHAVRDGYRAEPCEAEPYTYRDENRIWWTYDVEVDALVETEAPDWSR